jgi:hypothetical protein
MLHNSSARHQSLRSTVLSQVLAIAISTGMNYLLAINLGLFARFTPPKIRPIIGGVKVVDLTPAEQTRVPAAARSKPLPITPLPVIASPQPFNPFGQTNPVPQPRSSGGFVFPTVPPNRSQPPDLSPIVIPQISPQVSVRPSPRPTAVSPRVQPLVSPRPQNSVSPQPNSSRGSNNSPSPTNLDGNAVEETGSSLDDPNNERQVKPSSTPSPSPTRPRPIPDETNKNQSPGDLNTAISTSDAIMQRKKLVYGVGQIIAGGSLVSQSYPDKFKIKCADSLNGYVVLVFSVKPDQATEPPTIEMVDITVSDNLNKLAASLKPQQLVETILEEPSFAQLLEQGKQKAKNGYNNLKSKPALVYYRFPVPFVACPPAR